MIHKFTLIRTIFVLLGCLLIGCSQVNIPSDLPAGTTPTVAAISPDKTASITSAPELATSTISPSPTIQPSITNIAPQTQEPTVTFTANPTLSATNQSIEYLSATPEPAAECPKPVPGLQIEFPPLGNTYSYYENWSELSEVLLGYLNQGGSYNTLASALRKVPNPGEGMELWSESVDLTNDSVAEIIFLNPISDPDEPLNAIYVFACNRGEYETIFTWQSPSVMGTMLNFHIKDLNANHLPELIIQEGYSDYYEDFRRVTIYEWDGSSFQALLSVPYNNNSLLYSRGILSKMNPTYEDHFQITADAKFKFQDLDHDGTLEMIVTWESPEYTSGPARDPRIIYAWDGRYFSFYRVEYPAPEFRFQAIQDADDAVRFGEFDKAIDLYQDVIFSDQLDWYSKQRQMMYKARWNHSTPIPEDTTEYRQLAAYAYFRMILIHILRNEIEPVQIQIATLQKKFPPGDPGNSFVEMAAAFWEEYQFSQDIAAACASAIAYVDHNREMLFVLGSDYHGVQSQIYTPEDICPYR